MGIDPNWAKDPKIAHKTINAWVQEESSRGKIPYSISMKDDSPVFGGFVGVGEILPATNGCAPARSSRATERVSPEIHARIQTMLLKGRLVLDRCSY
jgi:hypothetical protein